MDKNCLNCGKIFTKDERAKYCPECRKKGTVTAICRTCGTSFKRKINRTNLCPSCKKVHDNFNRDLVEATTKVRNAMEDIHKADFSEYEKWHKETGRSYGEWQTMKRLEQEKKRKEA